MAIYNFTDRAYYDFFDPNTLTDNKTNDQLPFKDLIINTEQSLSNVQSFQTFIVQFSSPKVNISGSFYMRKVDPADYNTLISLVKKSDQSVVPGTWVQTLHIHSNTGLLGKVSHDAPTLAMPPAIFVVGGYVRLEFIPTLPLAFSTDYTLKIARDLTEAFSNALQ